MSTPGRVILVTGASRGIGRGVAVALAAPENTIYVTGRTVKPGCTALPGTIHETVAEIARRGGHGVACQCDHADDRQVSQLFAQIAREQGRLDLLVNNATTLPEDLVNPGPFWEKPVSMQSILDVGTRSHYVASWHAAKLMVPHRRGLIVMISSPGARCYMHGPAYGAGKAATDKMAADMAVDLKKYEVTAMSLWAPLTLTERSIAVLGTRPTEYAAVMSNAVHPEFMGRTLFALLADPTLTERTGRTYYAAELAAELGVTDIDGRQPPSDRAYLGEPAQVSGAIVGTP